LWRQAFLIVGIIVGALLAVDHAVRIHLGICNKFEALVSFTAVGIIPVIFMVLAYFFMEDSASKVSNILEDIMRLPWASEKLQQSEKMSLLLQQLKQLQVHTAQDAWLQTYAMFISLILVIALIWSTRAHPRTGVIVNTLIEGFNDLAHFSLQIALVFVGFMVVGYMQFGQEYDEFSSIGDAAFTLLALSLGELPEPMAKDRQMAIYLMMYIMITTFVVFNLLIAVIVEGFVVSADGLLHVRA
jgi:hypothetical protein